MSPEFNNLLSPLKYVWAVVLLWSIVKYHLWMPVPVKHLRLTKWNSIGRHQQKRKYYNVRIMWLRHIMVWVQLALFIIICINVK